VDFPTSHSADGVSNISLWSVVYSGVIQYARKANCPHTTVIQFYTLLYVLHYKQITIQSFMPIYWAENFVFHKITC